VLSSLVRAINVYDGFVQYMIDHLALNKNSQWGRYSF
jgi:hypothetical protein